MEHPLSDIENTRIAVIGMGNLLLKDEGIGVHVIRSLQSMPNLEGVLLIDGGTSPEALDLVNKMERLIIIDAIRGNDEPVSVYRLSPEQVETAKPSSIHEISVVSMLQTLSLRGENPEITIIGIEPKEIDIGLALSPELAERLPLITNTIYEEILRSSVPEYSMKRRMKADIK
jgi:hydrogenase maturation protease